MNPCGEFYIKFERLVILTHDFHKKINKEEIMPHD